MRRRPSRPWPSWSRRGSMRTTKATRRRSPQHDAILSAHARMIADPTLRRDARQRIEREHLTAEHAVSEVLEGHASRLERLADSHLAARAADIRDIEQRVLCQLSGGRRTSI